MTSSPLTLIVAVADDGTIGDGGKLPWHIPEDLRFFKAQTTGHAIIMGRKTWDSIGRPLPKRTSVVLTRNRSFRAEGAIVATTFEQALAEARRVDDSPFVIGGAAVYDAALPHATRILLTEVHQSPAGDVRFPAGALDAFEEVERTKGEGDGVEFVVYRRRHEGRGEQRS